MKFRLALLGILILSLALPACGSSGGGDPTKPVNDFFAAFADMDAEKAAKSVCSTYRDDTGAWLEMFFDFMAVAGDDAIIEVIDLELEVEDESDDEAMIVATSGTIKISLAGEVQQESDLTEGAEPLKVVKEDGKWYLCDAAFSEGLEP